MNEEDKLNFFKNYSNIVPVFDVVVRQQVGKLKQEKKINTENINLKSQISNLKSQYYFPFHNHTIFSVLQSTIKIPALVNFAYENNFPALGICDFGNLMGAFTFINEVKKINDKIKSFNVEAEEKGEEKRKKTIIPVIGCEVYISDDYKNKKFTKDQPDRRFTQVLLAKNQSGYKNLCKISTTGYTEGLYMDFPRVGKEVIEQYKEDLIATTGSLEAEIPFLILNQGISYAEEKFLWWKKTFGDDFYVQLQNHSIDEEKHVNEVLIEFAQKHNVKILAQNSTFYVTKEEHETHDIALCIKSNALKTTKIGRGFNDRLGMPSQDFFMKTTDEIVNSFAHLPESISNYEEFLNKFSFYDLARNVLLPKFKIPSSFENISDEQDGGKRGENAYLRYLTYEGAKKRYGENLSDEIRERLDFELLTIEKTGYPGYFLIVQDFTSEARKMGVSVGPGRGSAAGSAVAYCIGITNVDPIKYDLLFERFLNPDRVSLPDIDIDFDDRGRDKIIDYVVQKYGQNQVAQIITYGKLAGRSALRDTSRVLDLPLAEAGKLAKGLPASLSLNKIKNLSKEDLAKAVRQEELQGVQLLKDALNQTDLTGQVVKEAIKLEGCVRNTGVHACGVIITPEDITNLVPITVAKDAELLVSQFDNSVVESAGLLKMDFLGLKNLTIIQDACELIKQRHAVEINPDEIPLDDVKTLELFQRGETVGIFQFESVGCKNILKP
jgi:DNA polymerase-3 subunit alpha